MSVNFRMNLRSHISGEMMTSKILYEIYWPLDEVGPNPMKWKVCVYIRTVSDLFFKLSKTVQSMCKR